MRLGTGVEVFKYWDFLDQRVSDTFVDKAEDPAFSDAYEVTTIDLVYCFFSGPIEHASLTPCLRHRQWCMQDLAV